MTASEVFSVAGFAWYLWLSYIGCLHRVSSVETKQAAPAEKLGVAVVLGASLDQQS